MSNCSLKKLLAYAKEEKQFKIQDWSVFPHSTFLQAQYYLTKQQTFLELEKNCLDQLNISLQKRQTELEKLCQEHEMTRKIEITVAGILRKNFRFVRQLEEVESRAKEQLDALETRVARDKINTRYRVTVSDTLSNEKATSLIADAILFAPQAVQLVPDLAVTISKWKKTGNTCPNSIKTSSFKRKLFVNYKS